MTTPPPPPPPQQGPGGPHFGGEPHQPPHGAGRPPYGTPQPPYGTPQPPYGGQPPGGPWGTPPQGPQPSGGGRGNGPLIAVIAVCVAVVITAVTVTFFVLDSSDDEDGKAAKASESAQATPSEEPSGDDEPADDDPEETPDAKPGAKTLGMPKKILDDKYTLLQNLSDQFQKDAPGDDVTGLGGSYTGTNEDTLVVAAFEGDIDQPNQAKREFLKGTGSGANAKVTVQPRDLKVKDSTVTCQVITQTQAGLAVQMPVCAYADDETLIGVIHTDPNDIGAEAESIDLKAQAERVMKVLADYRAAA